MTLLGVVLLGLLCGIASAWAHLLKRRAWTWFLIACFLTPFVAYLLLLILSITMGVKALMTAARGSITDRMVLQQHDAEFHEEALAELEESRPVRAVWAKALVAANGDEFKARAFYIRSRCTQFVNDAKARPRSRPAGH